MLVVALVVLLSGLIAAPVIGRRQSERTLESEAGLGPGTGRRSDLPANKWVCPNGPWLLVSLGATALAIVGWGWATTLPADPQWFWLVAVGGLVASCGVVCAAHRPHDQFLHHWPASTLATVSLVALATILAVPIGQGTPAIVLVLGGVSLLVWPTAGLAGLIIGLIGLYRRPWDLVVAAALVLGTFLALSVLDPLAVRLRGGAGDRLAAEAEALTADLSVEAVHSHATVYPAVIEGTGRRVVVWVIPKFETQTPLLVHDPTGIVDADDPPGGMVDCHHIVGPWWECAFG